MLDVVISCSVIIIIIIIIIIICFSVSTCLSCVVLFLSSMGRVA